MTQTILEKAARALCASFGMNPDDIDPSMAGPDTENWKDWTHEATAALATLGLTPEQMQQPAGSMVVVPLRRDPSVRVAFASGQLWVPLNPKAKPRTITKIGEHRSYLWAGPHCVFFKADGDEPGPYPRVLHEMAFRRWVKARNAVLAARPGAGESGT